MVYIIFYRSFAINRIVMKRTTAIIDYNKDTEEVARIAKALSHPTRIKIIRYLAQQSYCFTGDLVDFLPLAQSTVSQHIRELRDAGLIEGEINPPKVRYCINKENWEKAGTLFATLFNTPIFNDTCEV